MTPKYGGSLPKYGVIRDVSWLAVCWTVNYALVGPFAFWLGGWRWLAISGAAGLACYGSSIAAVLISALLRGPDAPLLRLGVGIALRTGVPLVFMLAVYLQSGRETAKDVAIYLLAFYPVVLLVHTVLSLPRDDRARPAGVANDG